MPRNSRPAPHNELETEPMTAYTSYNEKMWDEWSSRKVAYTLPLSHEQFEHKKASPLELYLTPEKAIPLRWYEGLGNKVLGLASGGGQQGPVLKAHGYDVTILDNSKKQLESERMVAAREGYEIRLIKADMTLRFPFEDAEFDWILSPVSNCYIENLTHLWSECFRVLKPGGALLVGYTNPLMYLFDETVVWEQPLEPMCCTHRLPYNARELEEKGLPVTMEGGYQFSHTLESQIGGQLKAGFLLKDFFEDTDHGCRISEFSSLYMANLAIKPH